jgi:hypothetical protein
VKRIDDAAERPRVRRVFDTAGDYRTHSRREQARFAGDRKFDLALDDNSDLFVRVCMSGEIGICVKRPERRAERCTVGDTTVDAGFGASVGLLRSVKEILHENLLVVG